MKFLKFFEIITNIHFFFFFFSLAPPRYCVDVLAHASESRGSVLSNVLFHIVTILLAFLYRKQTFAVYKATHPEPASTTISRTPAGVEIRYLPDEENLTEVADPSRPSPVQPVAAPAAAAAGQGPAADAGPTGYRPGGIYSGNFGGLGRGKGRAPLPAIGQGQAHLAAGASDPRNQGPGGSSSAPFHGKGRGSIVSATTGSTFLS